MNISFDCIKIDTKMNIHKKKHEYIFNFYKRIDTKTTKQKNNTIQLMIIMSQYKVNIQLSRH